jgi:alpha-1,6-mannosyltransferase
VGTCALAGLLASALLLAGGAASRHSTTLVPSGGHARFPGWLAGPLSELGIATGPDRWQVELVALVVCYLLALACLPALGPRRVVGTIVLAHVIFVLGPPLLSADVLGYIDYARLGVVHGLDPYTHASLAAPHDPVFPYVGWRHARSPYGPLFTLMSYSLVPLGVPGSLWALKVLAGVFSLAALGVLWRAARWAGRAPLPAVALMGLNPVLLVFAVGGAHNDTLLLALMGVAVVLALSARPAGAAVALITAIGVKASAGLMLPFLVLGARRRVRTAVAALAAAIVLALVAMLAFGGHAAGFVNAVRGQQGLVAIHSVPAQTARLLGSPTLTDSVRTAFVILLVVVVVYQLWRVWRGGDWLVATGWVTLTLLISTAWLLPWYAVWLLPLTALRDDRRLRAATLLFCGYVLLTRLPVADPWLKAVL